MFRLGLIVWICMGALGLGLISLEAIRHKKTIHGMWYFLGVILGPVFLCFILPIWLGRWGKQNKSTNKE